MQGAGTISPQRQLPKLSRANIPIGGGIMASGGLSGMETGENVIIGGLVVQILFFTCFVVTAGIFHARLIRVPTGKSVQVHHLWTRSLYSLYAGSVLIWVRCVFRLIEYAQGMSGI